MIASQPLGRCVSHSVDDITTTKYRLARWSLVGHSVGVWHLAQLVCNEINILNISVSVEAYQRCSSILTLNLLTIAKRRDIDWSELEPASARPSNRPHTFHQRLDCVLLLRAWMRVLYGLGPQSGLQNTGLSARADVQAGSQELSGESTAIAVTFYKSGIRRRELRLDGSGPFEKS